MATAHLFMNVVGPNQSDVLGESQVDGREDQIIIDDWTWALVRKKVEGKADSIQPSVFSFSKMLDRSTSALLLFLQSGKELPSVEVTLEEGSEADFALAVTMKSVKVIDYKLDGEVKEKEAEAKEKWVFNYHTIEFDYKPSKKMSTEQRGALKAILTRPPGASNEPAADGQEQKALALMKTVPAKERRSLWKSVEGKLDSLDEVKPEPEPKKL